MTAAPSIAEDQAAPRLEVTRHSLGALARKLLPTLRPLRRRLILGCALVAVAGGIYGLMPLFSKFLIDRAIPRRSMSLALAIGGGFLATHLVRMSTWYLAMRQILMAQEQITYSLRTQGFGHLQRLSLRFHSRYPSGFLYQSIFGTAINTVGACMQTVFKQLSLYVTAIAISLGTCLYLSWRMTLVVLAGSCAYVAIARIASPRIYRRTRIRDEAQNRITEFIVDRLRGTKTIQALAMETRVQEDFEERLWSTQMKSLAVAKETFKLNISTEGCGYVVTSAIMVVGAYSLFHWDLSLGDLVAFMGYQSTFITIVSTLANIYGDMSSTRAGLDQLFTVMDTSSNTPEKPGAVMPAAVRGDITFRDVTFGYEPGAPVLKRLNVKVPAGQTLALVGASGGGKTTVTNLLLRFYDPDAGQVLLDGMDVRDLPLRPYRALYGVVLQDPYLFNESIRTNLRYASPEATDDEMIEALRHAQAWDFVRQFPGGLDQVVGEGGGSLSGGQRQRLAIARCLLLQTRFIILDEPTSALDVESEHLIQQALDKLFENRTVFIIAHRLSTIRRADRILVLGESGILQDGTYETLAAADGPFRRLHILSTGGTPAPAGG
jgi:ABC-type multidrug transport system fused ATPase/permease subunit